MGDFFKPANFVRSTVLGALNMGVSVAVGYWLTPVVTHHTSDFLHALEAGKPLALIKLVIAIDLAGIVAARAFSDKVFTRAIDANKDNISINKGNIGELMKRMDALESKNKRLSDKVVELGGEVADA